MVVKGMVIIWQYMPVLLYYIPVQVCEHCPELQVGSVGHNVRSCRGVGSETRQSSHVWRPAQLADVLPIPEAYHLWNRTAAPPCHTLAAQWGKVPAIMELCFQVGSGSSSSLGGGSSGFWGAKENGVLQGICIEGSEIWDLLMWLGRGSAVV